MLNIHPAFAVPFGDIHHPDCVGLNRELTSLILALEATGDAYRNVDAVVAQPQGLYESRFEFFARPEPVVAQLRAFCWAALGDFIRNVGAAQSPPPDNLRIASHTWFHVTRNGGHFGYHNHPMASWSGVYCVDHGAPDESIPNNGSLTFPHPLTAANAYLDAANSSLRWPFSLCNFAMNLVPGQLVLFPSWLGHYVAPFHGASPRITVAFNTWFARQD